MWYSSQNPVTVYYVVWSVAFVHWYLILISVLVIRVTPTNPAINQITQGASGLDGKPGARVSQYLVLLQRVCGYEFLCFRADPLGSWPVITWWGYLRLGWKENVDKDSGRKGIGWQSLGCMQLYSMCSWNCRTSFWSPGSSLENLLSGKNDHSSWRQCFRIPANISITNGHFL